MSREWGVFEVRRIKQYIDPLLNNYVQLPSNVLISLPKMTVIGQNHLYIENHHELMLFTESELKLKLHKGHVHIKGHSFVLKTMLPREILLEGIIMEIQFIS